MKKTSLFAALALTVAWSATVLLPPAAAQYDSSTLAQMGAMGTLNAHIAEQAKDPGYWNRHSGRGAGTVRGSAPRPAIPDAARGNMRFRFSSATRRGVLAKWVAQTRATDPQGAAKLQRDFARQDPIAAVAPAFPRYGLRKDDVADAMTLYLVAAWYGVRGSTQDPPRALVRGVREQMRGALLTLPKFAAVSNADKQQLADALVLQAIGNELLLRAAKGNAGKMANVKSLIRQGALNNFQLDLSKMKLTSSGLRS